METHVTKWDVLKHGIYLDRLWIQYVDTHNKMVMHNLLNDGTKQILLLIRGPVVETHKYLIC